MARRELPPAKLQEIREVAAQWGKIVARRAFGDAGPGADADLRTMEAVAQAAGRLKSFADAAFALELAGLALSARQVERIAAEVGRELAHDRDEKAARHRRRQLPVRVATTPEVVAVEVDGGRLRTREAGCGPGVHQAQNKEDKVACLVGLHSEVQEQDPQPEPPQSFLEPRRVQRLVRQMKGQAGEATPEEAVPGGAPDPEPPPAAGEAPA